MWDQWCTFNNLRFIHHFDRSSYPFYHWINGLWLFHHQIHILYLFFLMFNQWFEAYLLWEHATYHSDTASIIWWLFTIRSMIHSFLLLDILSVRAMAIICSIILGFSAVGSIVLRLFNHQTNEPHFHYHWLYVLGHFTIRSLFFIFFSHEIVELKFFRTSYWPI